MRPLNLKLFRDLLHMKGMVIAIMLVMACGIGTFVMYLSTIDSLRVTRASFYQDYRFSDVFASLKRAPEDVKDRILDIEGVQVVETRIVSGASLDIEGFAEPVRGILISTPGGRQPALNQLYLKEGRLVAPFKDNEVVLSDAFAEAHGLSPGDPIGATINGRRKTLIVVGVALSPEYIYQLGPGAIVPDYERFGILWMEREALGAAFNMEGAFNDLALSLAARAHTEEVIDEIDVILEPYGGLGAYARKNQQSHFFLSEEFRQLNQASRVIPTIFLGVAAFLLNVVIGRLVRTQREQIAILKAFGYGNLEIGLHFVKLVGVISLLGLIAGVLFGIWSGQSMATLYQEFFRFPYLQYRLEFRIVVLAALTSTAASMLGVLLAIRAAVTMPAAEAMRPQPPASYSVSVTEKLGLKRWFDQPTRMIVRHLERKPLKSLLTILGIAFGCSIVVMGLLFRGAVDELVDVQFRMAQKEDLNVSFIEPTSYRALYDLQGIEGVEYGEVFRSVPVRLRYGHRMYRTSLQGLMNDRSLFHLLDVDLKSVSLPEHGVMLSKQFQDILHVEEGDTITIEVLEGEQGTYDIPIAAFVNQYVGLGAYMQLGDLNRLLNEGSTISGVYLSIDKRYQDELYGQLKTMPRIMGIALRQSAIDQFYEGVADTWLIMAFFVTLFASITAFSIIYNSARISLSERGRELASLRVLGFTKGEISYILLGELAILSVLAIPLGFLIGWGLSAFMVYSLQTEMYRIPLVMLPSTYSLAATVVVVSACISGYIVYRRLLRLDLIGVLKTRE